MIARMVLAMRIRTNPVDGLVIPYRSAPVDP